MKFDIRTVLSATTKRLLTKPTESYKNGIDRLYDMFGHITGQVMSTTGLVHYADTVEDHIFKMYPELRVFDTGESINILCHCMDSEMEGDEAVQFWLKSVRLLLWNHSTFTRYGEIQMQDEYDIEPIKHETKEQPHE